jgi:hypothetical protein
MDLHALVIFFLEYSLSEGHDEMVEAALNALTPEEKVSLVQIINERREIAESLVIRCDYVLSLARKNADG